MMLFDLASAILHRNVSFFKGEKGPILIFLTNGWHIAQKRESGFSHNDNIQTFFPVLCAK